ncbi:MAG: alpha-(1-_3)-arabinofuranosyltransferase family protein, partial [Acidimicrobiia bacterium]|nr:alpha-(1->3)-arabinofuranosyltransferase family protein [Acidimicrobiia bacterium]
MSATAVTSTDTRSTSRFVPRRGSLLSHGVLALAIYPALLLTQGGQVAADSKPLLFIDAGRFFSRVAYLWDPTTGLGTVTHQNIGYLLPMGPWFWATEQLGVPVWVSQRLWLGSVLFVAGAGVLFLARTLRWPGTVGPTVAALAFALSPFVVQYATHLSVLLLPYAGLPWLVALTLRATRDGGWRWPAWFALVVALVGTINATTLACIFLGPAVVWVAELVRLWPARRRLVGAALRILGLSAAVSLWWIVALLIEGRYGVDVLDSSESLETVTVASTTPEVLRGLGYWFLYGRDAVAPYLNAGHMYMATWVLPVSFVPVLLAALAAVTTRWRRRGMFVALLVVGTVLAIGAHPYGSPSPFGGAFKSVVESVDAARALRSISRVTPLVVLAAAVLLGMGVTAVRSRFRVAGGVAAGVAVVAVTLAIAPLWSGDLVSGTRTRPETIPARWHEATATLDRAGTDTRVLELPGIDFAAYDWGYTNDSITRALMNRPTVAREVIPYGTVASVDLVSALDRRIQEGRFDPAALPAIARLIAASSVLVRGDLQSERYDLPDVARLRHALDPLPAGLTHSASFGDPATPELSILSVDGARRVVRAETADGPVLVSGSGEGLVDAAEAGVLPADRLIVYTGSLAGRPATAQKLLSHGAELIVTDSNRRRALRAKTLYDNNGYTERISESPLRTDLEDARFELFPDAGDGARTVAIAQGATARATSYGNPV